MKILLHPTYFPSISHFVAMLQADQILFEAHDNFQKQTNRNRMYIYSANGKQLLNIPIKHNKQQTHQKYKDIRIEYDFDWQKQHFKSLEAAYRSSPTTARGLPLVLYWQPNGSKTKKAFFQCKMSSIYKKFILS